MKMYKTMATLKVFPILVVITWSSAVFGENACCSYPCENQGICLTGKVPGSYSCDCYNLEYYGRHCETPTFVKRLKLLVRPSSEGVHNLLVSDWLKWIWDIVNSLEWLHDFFIRHIYLLRSNIVDSPPLYETGHEYPTITAHTNNTYYARTLPPVPLDCPTPMGTKGKTELPDAEKLIKSFFTRTQFRPEPMGSSLLMAYFAQHFTHMFFKTDFQKGPGFSWSNHGVDVTSIYGRNEGEEQALRSMQDGKLKLQEINGEYYPMYVKDVPGIQMSYPPNIPENRKFALGQPFFGLLPGLFLYQTIWMREHNKVCDILKLEHPDWDDERLFQTSKLVILELETSIKETGKMWPELTRTEELGETIKIVIEDYVQHLANYNIKITFRPEVLFGESFQYQNKINIEFNHLYHWHPLMPDQFAINGTIYPMKEYMFHSELVLKYGTYLFTESLSKQRAGHMSHHNHGPYTVGVLRDLIAHGRTLRLQPLNNYRKRFNLEVYTSFEDLTGEKDMAAELEELYGHIDAIEFYVGLLLEKRRSRNLFGSTIVEIGGPFSVKGLMSNPLCSKKYWKPSTFGGDVGFNIVKSATLRGLFCGNIKGACPLVSLRVPEFYEGDVDEFSTYTFKRIKDEL